MSKIKLVPFNREKANAMSLSKRSLIYGFGSNDAWYKTHYESNGKLVTCPFYEKWTGMIQRCYSPEHLNKFPSYIDCTVCEQWKRFSAFKVWAETKNWQGMDLDKDLKVVGNKMYSPETCLFIPKRVNYLIAGNQQANASTKGVRQSRHNEKFEARCWVDGKPSHLGTFDTKDKAVTAYKKTKKQEMLRVARLYPELYEYIIQHAESI